MWRETSALRGTQTPLGDNSHPLPIWGPQSKRYKLSLILLLKQSALVSVKGFPNSFRCRGFNMVFSTLYSTGWWPRGWASGPGERTASSMCHELCDFQRVTSSFFGTQFSPL